MAKLKARDSIATPDTLEDIIEEFYEADTNMKSYKKEADKYKEEAKDRMYALDMDTYEGDNLVATITTQDRSSMNEDKLLVRIRELGFEDAIQTKEYVDEEAVEDLIYTGKLAPEQIADCMESKIVKVFSVKPKKKAKVK